MRFLADESCDFTAVRALRDAGHEVLAVAEAAGGAEDSDVLALASREGRVLLTEDKDFGQLARAGEKKFGGVILLRYPHVARASVVAALVHLAVEQGEQLHRRFVVVEPGRVRISSDYAGQPTDQPPAAPPAPAADEPSRKPRTRRGKK